MMVMLAFILSSAALPANGEVAVTPDKGHRQQVKAEPQKLTGEQRKAMAEPQKLTEEQRKAMAEQARQRDEERQKRMEEHRKVMAGQMKQWQEQMEARRKAIQERLAASGADTLPWARDSAYFFRFWDDYFRHAREGGDSTRMFRTWHDYSRRSDARRKEPAMVMPGFPGASNRPQMRGGRGDSSYEGQLYDILGYGSRPGAAWSYSRKVAGATFTNDLTMQSGDEENVNLTVSGRCTGGAIKIEVITPDGSRLEELDLNNKISFNWRKSLKTTEGKGWKGGVWTFRVKASDATGSYHISLSAY